MSWTFNESWSSQSIILLNYERHIFQHLHTLDCCTDEFIFGARPQTRVYHGNDISIFILVSIKMLRTETDC